MQAFTDDEQNAIRWYIGKVHPVLQKRYPLFAQTPWSFLKVSNRIEGGLPHTRGKHIVLSGNVCRMLVQVKQRRGEGRALRLGGLFVHEQMHVFQRTHPDWCRSLYVDVWGFVRAEKIEGCDWLVKHHLTNPDGPDCSWVFPVRSGGETRYIWPLVVFAEGDRVKRMPRDFQMIAIDLAKTYNGFRVQTDGQGRPLSRRLTAVKEYTQVFFGGRNVYHPHEAAADLFSTIVMFDPLMLKDKRVAARFRQKLGKLGPLREWFQEHLGGAQEGKTRRKAA